MNDIALIHQIGESLLRDIDPSLYYSEACYQQLLAIRLSQAGFDSVEREVKVNFSTSWDEMIYGHGRIDVLVESSDRLIIIETKANQRYTRKKAISQTQRYMLHYKTDKRKHGIVMLFNCQNKDYESFDVMMPFEATNIEENRVILTRDLVATDDKKKEMISFKMLNKNRFVKF